MVQPRDVVWHEAPPGAAVAVYVTAAKPSSTGAPQTTPAAPSKGRACTLVGAPGTEMGVTPFE